MTARQSTLTEAGAWRQALGDAGRYTANYAKGTGRDIKIARRSIKYLGNSPRKMSQNNKLMLLKDMPMGAANRSTLTRQVAQQDRFYKRQAGQRNASLGRTAVRAGVAIVGLTAARYGLKAARNLYKKNRGGRPQFREYDVHPQHQHAAVPRQVVNRPYYPDEENGGPPRVHEGKSRELPKQITGFQRKRRRYRFAGIRSKMHPYKRKVHRFFKKREKLLDKKMVQREKQVKATPSAHVDYNRRRANRTSARLVVGALSGRVAGHLMSSGFKSNKRKSQARNLGTVAGAFAGAGANALAHERDHYHSMNRALHAPSDEKPMDLPGHYYMGKGQEAHNRNRKLRQRILKHEARREVVDGLVEVLLGC